jgi:hypothetical protein
MKDFLRIMHFFYILVSPPHQKSHRIEYLLTPIQTNIGQKSSQETSLTIVPELHQAVGAMPPYTIQNNSSSKSTTLSHAHKNTIVSTYRRFKPPPMETDEDEVNPFSDPESTSVEERANPFTDSAALEEETTTNPFSDAVALNEEMTSQEVLPKISFRARVSSIQTRVYDALPWKPKFVGPKSKICKSLNDAMDAIKAHEREEGKEEKKAKKVEKEGKRRNSDVSIKSFLGASRGEGKDYERDYEGREYATVSGGGWKNWGGMTGLGI